MQTEYEFSARLICWGDQLVPVALVEAMGVDESLCAVRIKGELLIEGDNNHASSYAKTGMLTFTPEKQNNGKSHYPHEQLEEIAGALNKVPKTLSDSFNVEKSELQIYIFYGSTSQGEPDFLISSSLLMALTKHRIQLRITVLP